MVAYQNDMRRNSLDFYHDSLRDLKASKSYIEGQTGLSIDECTVLRMFHYRKGILESESLIKELPHYRVEEPKGILEKLVKKRYLQRIRPSKVAPKWRIKLSPEGEKVVKKVLPVIENPAPFQRS